MFSPLCWLFGHDMTEVRLRCVGLSVDGLDVQTYPATQLKRRCSRLGCRHETVEVKSREE